MFNVLTLSPASPVSKVDVRTSSAATVASHATASHANVVLLPAVADTPHNSSSRSVGQAMRAFTVSSFSSAPALTVNDSASFSRQDSSRRRHSSTEGSGFPANDGMPRGSSFNASVSGRTAGGSSGGVPSAAKAEVFEAPVPTPATASPHDKYSAETNWISTEESGGEASRRPCPPPLATVPGVPSTRSSPQGQSGLTASTTPPSPPVFLETASVVDPLFVAAAEAAVASAAVRTGASSSSARAAPVVGMAPPTPSPVVESSWVDFDTYLALSSAVLRHRAVQDRVAELCCPTAVSGDGQTRLVCVDSILPFLLHGSRVAPPAAARLGTAALNASAAGAGLSAEAQRVCFPLFCLMGAKLCGLSESTHAIRSIHRPIPPLTLSLALRPGRLSTGQLPGRDTASRPHILLLFAEQLCALLPGLPLELLHTTSPSGEVVAAPPFHPPTTATATSTATVGGAAAAVWPSWQATPPTARQTSAYSTLWGVVTLQRFTVLLHRWGLSPMAVLARLAAESEPASSSRPDAPLATDAATLAGEAEPPRQLPSTQSTSYLSIQTSQAALAEEQLSPLAAGLRAEGGGVGAPVQPLPYPPSRHAAGGGSAGSTTSADSSVAASSTVASSQRWELSSVRASGTGHGGHTPATAAAAVPTPPRHHDGRYYPQRPQQHHHHHHHRDGACVRCSLFGTPLNSDDTEYTLDGVGHKAASEECHPYNASLATDPKARSDTATHSPYGTVHRYDVPLPPRPSSATSAASTAASFLRTFAGNSGVVPRVMSRPASCVEAWGLTQGTLVPSPPTVPAPPFSSHRAAPGRHNDAATALPPRPESRELPTRRSAVPGSRAAAQPHPYNVDSVVRTSRRRRHARQQDRSGSHSRHKRRNHADISAPVPAAVQGGGDAAATTTAGTLPSEGVSAKDCLGGDAAASVHESALSSRWRTEQVNAYVQTLVAAAASHRNGEGTTAPSNGTRVSSEQSPASVGDNGMPAAAESVDTHACSGRSNTSANANSLNGRRSAGKHSGTPSRARAGETPQEASSAVQHVPAPPPHPPLRQPNPHSSILQSWEGSMISQLEASLASVNSAAASGGVPEQATPLPPPPPQQPQPSPSPVAAVSQRGVLDSAAAAASSIPSTASSPSPLTPETASKPAPISLAAAPALGGVAVLPEQTVLVVAHTPERALVVTSVPLHLLAGASGSAAGAGPLPDGQAAVETFGDLRSVPAVLPQSDSVPLYTPPVQQRQQYVHASHAAGPGVSPVLSISASSFSAVAQSPQSSQRQTPDAMQVNPDDHALETQEAETKAEDLRRHDAAAQEEGKAGSVTAVALSSPNEAPAGGDGEEVAMLPTPPLPPLPPADTVPVSPTTCVVPAVSIEQHTPLPPPAVMMVVEAALLEFSTTAPEAICTAPRRDSNSDGGSVSSIMAAPQPPAAASPPPPISAQLSEGPAIAVVPPLSQLAAQLRALIAPVLQAAGRGYLARRQLACSPKKKTVTFVSPVTDTPLQREAAPNAAECVTPSATAASAAGAILDAGPPTLGAEPAATATAAESGEAFSPAASEGRKYRAGRPPPLTAFAAPQTPSLLHTPDPQNLHPTPGGNGGGGSQRGPPDARERRLNRSASSQSSGTSSHDPQLNVSPTQRLFAIYGIPSSSVMENSSSSWMAPPPSSSSAALAAQSTATAMYVASYNESRVLEGNPLRSSALGSGERSSDTAASSCATSLWARSGERPDREGAASTHTLPPLPRDDSSSSEENSGRRGGPPMPGAGPMARGEGTTLMTSVTVPPSSESAEAAQGPPSLMRPLSIPPRDRLGEGTMSALLRDSTEDFILLRQSRLGANGSCTVAFLDQTARGPASGSITSSSQDRMSPDRTGVAASPAAPATRTRAAATRSSNEWAVRSAMALLLVQRIGRGFLARHEVGLRYADVKEEDDLDAMLHGVFWSGPQLPPSRAMQALAMNEAHPLHPPHQRTDGVVAAVAPVPSGVTGLSSAVSSNSATPLSTPPQGPVPHPPPPPPEQLPVPSPADSPGSSAAATPSPSMPMLAPPLSPFQVPTEELAVSTRSSMSSAAVAAGGRVAEDVMALVCSTASGSAVASASASASASKSGGSGIGIPMGSWRRGVPAAGAGRQNPLRESSPFVTPDASRNLLPPELAGPSAPPAAVQRSPPVGFGRSNSLSLSKGAASALPVGESSMAHMAEAFGKALLNHTTPHSASEADPPSLPESASRRIHLQSPASPRVSFSASGQAIAVEVPASAVVVAAETASGGGNDGSSSGAPARVGGGSPRWKFTEGVHSAAASGRPPVTREGQAAFGAAAASAGPIPCWKVTTAAAGAVLSPMEGSLFAASGRSGRSMSSATSLPFDFSTTAHATNAMSQADLAFSGRTIGSITPPAQWMLDAVEGVEASARFDDGESGSDDNEGSGGSDSDGESDDEDAHSSDEDVSEADAFRRDISQVENGGAEPACFGAAAHLLRGEKTQITRDGALALLQRVGRGYLCRRHQHFLFMVAISFTEVALLQRVAVGYLTRRRMGVEFHVNRLVREEVAYWELRNRAAIRLHAVVRGFLARQRVKRLQRKLFTRIELRTALELPDPDE